MAMDKHVVLYVVGPPGVGKTTLVREMFKHLDPRGERYLIDKPKWTVGASFAAAGHYSGKTFDGADTVPYNAAQETLNHWARDLVRRVPLTILDGDRFSHEKALKFLELHGAVVRIAYLGAPDEILRERRAARGSNQNPAWVRGRETKARRFAELDKTAIRLEATKPPAELRDGLFARLQAEVGAGPWSPS